MSARHVQQICERLVRGVVDVVITNGDVPFWDLHVLREHTRRHAAELVVLEEGRFSEDLDVVLGRVTERLRRPRPLDARAAAGARPPRAGYASQARTAR